MHGITESAIEYVIGRTLSLVRECANESLREKNSK
jgi:hypothetical protein